MYPDLGEMWRNATPQAQYEKESWNCILRMKMGTRKRQKMKTTNSSDRIEIRGYRGPGMKKKMKDQGSLTLYLFIPFLPPGIVMNAMTTTCGTLYWDSSIVKR